MSISVIPLLLIVALAVVLPTLIVLTLAFAAIKRKNWGSLAVLGVVMFALPAAWLLAGVSVTHQQDVRAEAEAKADFMREQARQIVKQVKQEALANGSGESQLPWESAPEVASDEELTAIASAPPKIELDSEIVIGDKAEDLKSDRPDWIDAHLGDNQKLIVSGPFTTKESCESDTQKQIVDWLRSRHMDLWPNGDGNSQRVRAGVSKFIKSQHEELRATSVGVMHFLYTLAEVAPEAEGWIAHSIAEAAAQAAQRRGVRAITFTGFGVLSLVALTHVVLRSGGRKSENSAASARGGMSMEA